MTPEFVDTNIIIRYVTGDNLDQSARSLALLQEVERGQRTATTCEGVLVEAVQVLSSKRLYAFPRPDIHAALADIIQMRGFQLPNKDVYLRALDRYAASNLDFVDALEVAHMEQQGISDLISFDREFDRVSGIKRREP